MALCLGALVLGFAGMAGAAPGIGSIESAVAGTACPNADARARTATRAEFRAAVLCLINEERASRDRRRLRKHEKLVEAAQAHTDTMQATGCFLHECPGEPSLKQRLKRVGYIRADCTFFTFGQVIGFGTGADSTPRAMVQAWLGPDGHRKLILKRAFRDGGVGIRFGTPTNPDANGTTFTVNLGARDC